MLFSAMRGGGAGAVVSGPPDDKPEQPLTDIEPYFDFRICSIC